MRTCAEKFLSFFLLCLVILLHSSEADAFTRFHPPDGVYSIQPRCAPSAELSTANKGKSNGVNVLLAPISSSNPKWRITRINNTDWYKITVEGTNVGLNVDNGRNVSGTNITLWTYGGTWQQFCFWDIGEGDYYYRKF